MRVVTIGGATQDIYLMHGSSDMMTLTQKDLTVDYMLLRTGNKIEVHERPLFVGGGATNTAASFKQQGIESSCFFTVGVDSEAAFILEDLKQRGIDTSAVVQKQDLKTGMSCIIKAANKERTIFAFRGANGSMDQSNISYEHIKNSNQLYITSLSGASALLLPEIINIARKYKVSVAINPGMSQLAGGAKLLREVLPYIDVFILNYEEAKAFMLSLAEANEAFKKAFTFSTEPRSCPIDTAEISKAHADDEPYLIDNPIACENLTFSIRNYFQQMLELGPRIVVVTNGSNGVYVATKEVILFHPSIKTILVDTVGAGDSFGSCFVGSLLYQDSLELALHKGVINSASVLSNLGAKSGLLGRDELEVRAKHLSLDVIKKFTL